MVHHPSEPVAIFVPPGSQPLALDELKLASCESSYAAAVASRISARLCVGLSDPEQAVPVPHSLGGGSPLAKKGGLTLPRSHIL